MGNDRKRQERGPKKAVYIKIPHDDYSKLHDIAGERSIGIVLREWIRATWNNRYISNDKPLPSSNSPKL
jgi:hypothetical protein